MLDRAELRRIADEALEAFGQPRVIAAGRSGRHSPPTITAPADRVMMLRLECACGHVGHVRMKPAHAIQARFVCRVCTRPVAPI